MTHKEALQKIIDLVPPMSKEYDIALKALSTEVTEPRMFSEEEVLDLLCDYADLIHSTKSRKPYQKEWLDNHIQSLSPKKGKEESFEDKVIKEAVKIFEQDGFNVIPEPNQVEPHHELDLELIKDANSFNQFEGKKPIEPNQTEAEKEVSGSLIYSYLRSEYTQQLERMEKIGINVDAQFFEQCINTLLLMVEQKQWFDAVSKNKLSLARKQVIEEIEEWVKKESISATDEGGVFYENVIDSDYLLTKLQTLKP